MAAEHAGRRSPTGRFAHRISSKGDKLINSRFVLIKRAIRCFKVMAGTGGAIFKEALGGLGGWEGDLVEREI